MASDVPTKRGGYDSFKIGPDDVQSRTSMASKPKQSVKGTSTRSPLLDVLRQNDSAPPKADMPPSLYSQFIPVTPVNRPHTFQSSWIRPSTGRSHFSIEEARRNQRRIVEADINDRPSSRDALRGLGLGPANNVPRLAVETRLEHDHSRPSCRQCFRSGFDCAIQLQNGRGTAARKALQDFVAAGGMEALSGVEDFYEGSVQAGMAISSRPASRAAGQNFVDKLSEVAFGESALSRPVTRDAVQNMLDERSRGFSNIRNDKTVNEFMAELQLLQQQQQQREIDTIVASKGGVNKNDMPPDSPKQASSRSSAETMHDAYIEEAAEHDQNAAAHLSARPSEEFSVTRSQPYLDGEAQYVNDDMDDDYLPFLADRWPLKVKFIQLGVCALWLFVIQCLDSGYGESSSAIALSTDSDPVILQAGRLAYLAGQGAGFLTGSALSPYGRLRIQPISVVLALALSLITGFMHQIYAVLALRGAMGYLGGIFELSVCGMVLDLSIRRRERLFLIAFVAVPILAGQVAGPWITKLVLAIATWRWLYWTTTVAAAFYLIVSLAFLQETEPVSVFRRLVKRLRVQHQDVWTPEPEPVPGLLWIAKTHAVRPLHLLFRHGLVILCTILLFVAAGATSGVVSSMLLEFTRRNDLSSWQVTLLVSISMLIGSVGALAFVTFAASRSNNTTDQGRKRFLLMDEKGVIDPIRPAFDAEVLLRNAISGLIASSVALYLLALSSQLTHWLFSALSVTVLAGGTTILVVSVVQYVSEAYFPSTSTTLADLHLLPELQERPDNGTANGAAENGLSRGSMSHLDNTLMSAVDAEGKRCDSSWALSVLAVTLAAAFVAAGAMTLLAPFAILRIGFPVFTAIMSSVELGVGGLCLLLLVSSGSRMRHRSFARIQQVEQRNHWSVKRNRRLSTAASAQTSTGIIRSPPRSTTASGDGSINTLSRPLHQRLSRSDWLKWIGSYTQKQEAGVLSKLLNRFKDLLTIRRTASSKRHDKAHQDGTKTHQISISEPFDFHHVATGSMLASPATLRDQVSPKPLSLAPVHLNRTAMSEEQLSQELTPESVHWTQGRSTLRRVVRKDLERALKAGEPASPMIEQQSRMTKIMLSPPPQAFVAESQHARVNRPPISVIDKRPMNVVYERQRTPPTEIVYRKPDPVVIPVRNAENVASSPHPAPTIRPVASTSRRTLTPKKDENGKITTEGTARSLPMQRQIRKREAAHGGANLPKVC